MKILNNDLSLTNFVSSDFPPCSTGAWPRHYGIPGVGTGQEFKKVTLAAGQPPRPALLTMAGVIER